MVNYSIENLGWVLVSAVERNVASPDTFNIPSELARNSLKRGDAAKILFDIETKEGGIIVDRGVDRMWVIVTSVTGAGYIGVLDSDPGYGENLKLAQGDLIEFGAEHVSKIDNPPAEYLTKEYGELFSS